MGRRCHGGTGFPVAVGLSSPRGLEIILKTLGQAPGENANRRLVEHLLVINGKHLHVYA